MTELRYTLLADGPSDRALLPLLTWTLRTQGVARAIASDFADLRRLRQRPRGLVMRIAAALLLYPCDLLFIHRDAEREPYATRHSEITQAVGELVQRKQELPATVCVVPVRMHEAWLLFDEAAIRAAAGNPNGRQALQLPRIADIEGMPDPKDVLHQLTRTASGLRGRRLAALDVPTWRVAELIDDFAPLRALPAFAAFERELAAVVGAQGWRAGAG